MNNTVRLKYVSSESAVYLGFRSAANYEHIISCGTLRLDFKKGNPPVIVKIPEHFLSLGRKNGFSLIKVLLPSIPSQEIMHVWLSSCSCPAGLCYNASLYCQDRIWPA